MIGRHFVSKGAIFGKVRGQGKVNKGHCRLFVIRESSGSGVAGSGFPSSKIIASSGSGSNWPR